MGWQYLKPQFFKYPKIYFHFVKQQKIRFNIQKCNVEKGKNLKKCKVWYMTNKMVYGTCTEL